VSGPLLDALLRASLHGALFVGVVWAICRLLPGLSASVRCVLWWLACLKIVAGLASPVELPWLPAASVETAAPIAGFAPLLNGSTPADVGAGHAAPFRFPWAATLAGVWLAGVLVQLGATARQLRHARGLVRRAVPPGEPWVAARFDELRRELGLGERPELRASTEVEAPQVLGLLRPVVLLPASRPLSGVDLSMALCHELIHVRRADLWWGWGPALAQRLFWFHPLVRLAAREYALAREAACDAEVLRVLDPEPRAYGRLLLSLGIAPRATSLAAAGAAPSVQTLKRRLQMLEQSSANRRLPLGWAGLIVLVAGLAVVPFRIIAQDAPPAPPVPPAIPAIAPMAPAAPPVPAIPAIAPMAPVTPPVPAIPPVPPRPFRGLVDDALRTGKAREVGG
jgi:beta-lactamase regulating signal transducer with metallopeptidase domain